VATRRCASGPGASATARRARRGRGRARRALVARRAGTGRCGRGRPLRRSAPADTVVAPVPGIEVERRWLPVDSVGIYVPAGLVSTLVMTAVPARVAGVERIAGRDPAPEPWRCSAPRVSWHRRGLRGSAGAQAIAALAYGTETIPRVARSSGRGTASSPKRSCSSPATSRSTCPPARARSSSSPTTGGRRGRCSRPACPGRATARNGTSILVTTSSRVADAVAARTNGQARIETVATLGDAVARANELAPEHLELLVDDPDALGGRRPQRRRSLPRHDRRPRRLRRRLEQRPADRAAWPRQRAAWAWRRSFCARCSSSAPKTSDRGPGDDRGTGRARGPSLHAVAVAGAHERASPACRLRAVRLGAGAAAARDPLRPEHAAAPRCFRWCRSARASRGCTNPGRDHHTASCARRRPPTWASSRTGSCPAAGADQLIGLAARTSSRRAGAPACGRPTYSLYAIASGIEGRPSSTSRRART